MLYTFVRLCKLKYIISYRDYIVVTKVLVLIEMTDTLIEVAYPNPTYQYTPFKVEDPEDDKWLDEDECTPIILRADASAQDH